MLPEWAQVIVAGLFVSAGGAYFLRLERHISAGHELRSLIAVEMAKFLRDKEEMQREVEAVKVIGRDLQASYDRLAGQVAEANGKLDVLISMGPR